MRRLSWWALALSAACGSGATIPPGPLNQMNMPTGLAVLNHQLLVASSNANLLFSDNAGGAILNLDPSQLPAVSVVGAINVPSFAGDLKVARIDPQIGPNATEPDYCGPAIGTVPLAVFATRGSNTLNILTVEPGGVVACRNCGLTATGTFGDPFPVAIACSAARKNAFIGYLSAENAFGWVTKLDLETGTVQGSLSVGEGDVRGLAYDVAHDRLYLTELATWAPTPLRWIELGGCNFAGQIGNQLGCTVNQAYLPGFPPGTELRAIALAHPHPPDPQRAFITVRYYDIVSASSAGGATTDFGGVLVVVDLVDNAQGGVDPQVVRIVPGTGTLGHGLQDIRVFPQRTGKRDAVAVISETDGYLWLYDDETGALNSIGLDLIGPNATGAPILGHQPSGLAVDPISLTTNRLWVGSYLDSFVTPLDIPVDSPTQFTFATGSQLKITGGTP